MDFKEMRFPLEVSAHMVGGPMFSTRMFTAQNGDRTPLALWAYPLHKWQITNGLRVIADAADMKRFQLRAMGQGFAFRVIDPMDYSAVIGEGFLIATEAPHVFQLVKRYAMGDETIGELVMQRKIQKPAPGTVAVYTLAGMSLVSGAVVDARTGLVTISGATDATLFGWRGLFDTPVSFGEDWLQVGASPEGLLDITSMTLVEPRRLDASFGTPPPLFLPFTDPSGIDRIGGPVPGPAPGPAPGPGGPPGAPAPAGSRTPATFDPTRKSTDATLSAGNKTLSSGSSLTGPAATALSTVAVFSGTAAGGAPTSGYAVEFTIGSVPSDSDYMRLGIASPTLTGLGLPNNVGYIDSRGAYALNSGSAGSSPSMAQGDKVGLVLYANNGAYTSTGSGERAHVAVFINGTLIVASAAEGSGLDPGSCCFFASLYAASQSVSVECDISAMAHGSTYAAFRESGVPVLDAGTWGS